MSLAATLNQTGGTTTASAIATQRGRQRIGAATAVPEARGDCRAHGATGDTCGGGTGPADRAAGHATAQPGRADPPSGATCDRANPYAGPRGAKRCLRTQRTEPA